MRAAKDFIRANMLFQHSPSNQRVFYRKKVVTFISGKELKFKTRSPGSNFLDRSVGTLNKKGERTAGCRPLIWSYFQNINYRYPSSAHAHKPHSLLLTHLRFPSTPACSSVLQSSSCLQLSYHTWLSP